MRKYIFIVICILFGITAFSFIDSIIKEGNNVNTNINDGNANNKEKEQEEVNEQEEQEEVKEQEEVNEQEEQEEITSKDFGTIPTFKEENYERYLNYKKNNPSLSNEEIVMRINVLLDYGFYEKKIDAINKNTPLILVNKYYYIDETYIPDNLVEVGIKYASGGGIYADNEAVTYFMSMCNDASSLGLSIKTISAYRTYNYQKALYEGYLKNDSVASVDTYSARAGHSEHQTGYAFDVYDSKNPYTSFGDTDEFEWVKINAHRYGFIIRYTEENSYITGYKNEPWHLRYIGIEPATYIYEHNVTLEEYLLNRK